MMENSKPEATRNIEGKKKSARVHVRTFHCAAIPTSAISISVFISISTDIHLLLHVNDIR